jgi:hypothetical protein
MTLVAVFAEQKVRIVKVNLLSPHAQHKKENVKPRNLNDTA